ncbi:MAG TPA: RDD family protein [Blastocatellia bacterium]|nr:RDD family protein [Blastocatellia bacterium]
MSYEQPQGGYGAPPGWGATQGYAGTPPQPVYAGMGKRFLAAIIDGFLISLGGIPGWIVIMISAVGAVSTADARGNISNDAAGAMMGGIFLGYFLLFIGSVLVWLFQIYLLGRDGATLGKRWLKIKVVDQTGQPLGFGKAFLRELVKQLLGGLCFLLYLWPLFDNQKQGLWDKLFNTHVYDA